MQKVRGICRSLPGYPTLTTWTRLLLALIPISTRSLCLVHISSRSPLSKIMECWKSSVEIGLLEDAGISPQDIYKKIVSKCIKLLQDSTTVEQIRHNHLLGYLRMLAQYTASSKLNITSIYQSVVDGIIGPYLQIIQRSTETQIQILSPCTTAIQNLLSLLSSDGIAQVCVVQYLSSLFKSVGNSLSAPSEETNFNAQFVLTFVSEIFQKISVECLEKGGSDFSCVFEQALGVLKLSDAKMCFVLASSILPRFITSLHTHRAEKIWSLVEAVYLGRVNVEQIQLEFILTILCCFRDVFVQHDKSSPFSNPFVHSVLSLSPLVDIRVKITFWRVIQEGLVSANPFSRKRCMYLVNCVLLSALDCKTSDICSEGQVFWWAAENTKQLKSVWDDLILVLETMEEKQVNTSHIHGCFFLSCKRFSVGIYFQLLISNNYTSFPYRYTLSNLSKNTCRVY